MESEEKLDVVRSNVFVGAGKELGKIWFWVRQTWVLLLWGALFGLISVYFSQPEFNNENWLGNFHWAQILSAEIAIAFVVAWLLILTAERKHSERTEEYFKTRQQKLSQNIFDYIYGVRVPPALFKFIEDKIYKAKFFRENVRIDYTFQTIEHSNNWKLWAVLSFRVVNLTGKKEKYEIQGTIEKPHNQTLVGATLGVQTINVDDKDLTATKMKAAKTAAKNTKDQYRLKHKISIPANGSKEVRITYLMEKECSDYEVWRCIEPCEGLSVQIKAPENMKIKMCAIHPNRKFDHDNRNAENGCIQVEIRRPLLPQNGVLFWWECDSAKSANKGTIATK